VLNSDISESEPSARKRFVAVWLISTLSAEIKGVPCVHNTKSKRVARGRANLDQEFEKKQSKSFFVETGIAWRIGNTLWLFGLKEVLVWRLFPRVVLGFVELNSLK